MDNGTKLLIITTAMLVMAGAIKWFIISTKKK